MEMEMEMEMAMAMAMAMETEMEISWQRSVIDTNLRKRSRLQGRHLGSRRLHHPRLPFLKPLDARSWIKPEIRSITTTNSERVTFGSKGLDLHHHHPRRQHPHRRPQRQPLCWSEYYDFLSALHFACVAGVPFRQTSVSYSENQTN